MIDLLTSGAATGATWGLFGVGLALILRTSQTIQVTYAAVYFVSAYVIVLLSATISFTFALAAAIVAATLFGVLIELTVARPLRRSQVSGLGVLLLTLGLFVVIQNVCAMLVGVEPRVLHVQPLLQFHSRVPAADSVGILSALAVAVALSAARRTRIGRHLTAVAADAHMARVMGLRVETVRLIAAAGGSAVGALAGVPLVLSSAATIDLAFPLFVSGVAVTLLTPPTRFELVPVVGIALGVVVALATFVIPPAWHESVIYVLALAIILQTARMQRRVAAYA